MTLVVVLYVFLRSGVEPVEVRPGPDGLVAPAAITAHTGSTVRPGANGASARVPDGLVAPAQKDSSTSDPARERRRDFGRKRNQGPKQLRARMAGAADNPEAGKFFDPEPPNPNYDRPYETGPEFKEPPYLLVYSQPPGMNVYIDDAPMGMTPLLRQLTVVTERLRIKVSGLGFETVDRVVEADQDGHIRMGINMKPTTLRK